MLQRRRQLRPAAERIGALAGLDLGVLCGDLETLGRIRKQINDPLPPGLTL
jgi:hypothetical protein